MDSGSGQFGTGQLLDHIHFFLSQHVFKQNGQRVESLDFHFDWGVDKEGTVSLVVAVQLRELLITLNKQKCIFGFL